MEKNNNLEILSQIELTEEQAQAVISALYEWKEKVMNSMKESSKKYEESIREALEEEYGAKFEEAYQMLKKLYSERLDEAIKNLKNVIREELEKENKEKEDIINKIKSVILPFVTERELIKTIEEQKNTISSLKAEIEKQKGITKFMSLIKEFPEDVQSKILEEVKDKIVNEDTAVEEYSRLIKIMKTTASKIVEEIKEEQEEKEEKIKELIDDNDDDTIKEGSPDPDPDPNPDPVLNVWKKRKILKKGKRPWIDESQKDDEEIDNIIEESLKNDEAEVITESENRSKEKEISYDIDEIKTALRLRNLAGIK